MAGQPKYVDVPWQALFADVMTLMKEGSQRITSSFDEKSPALGELSQAVSAVGDLHMAFLPKPLSLCCA